VEGKEEALWVEGEPKTGRGGCCCCCCCCCGAVVVGGPREKGVAVGRGDAAAKLKEGVMGGC